MNDYADFLERKRIVDAPTGLDVVPALNPMLFAFQKDMAICDLPYQPLKK